MTALDILEGMYNLAQIYDEIKDSLGSIPSVGTNPDHPIISKLGANVALLMICRNVSKKVLLS
ncbi:MAG: hypothetical protein WCC17_14310, partial [Candidatus Nitrosopolaris sp.]